MIILPEIACIHLKAFSGTSKRKISLFSSNFLGLKDQQQLRLLKFSKQMFLGFLMIYVKMTGAECEKLFFSLNFLVITA